MSLSRMYRRLAELPVFISTSFISPNQISLESTVRDHVNNVKRSLIQEVGIPDELSTGSTSSAPKFWLSTPVERSETVVARLISPSGRRTAVLKETVSTPKKRFVEIWKGDCAELILETTSRHGSFNADATFSSLCFSAQEDALLYTAESNPSEEDPKDPFHKFRFEAHHGEQFIDRRRPTLFWLRWETIPASLDPEQPAPANRLIEINPTMEHLPSSLSSSHHLEHPPVFSLGQAAFASSSARSVLATAYLRTKGDRKLGIVYCTNRPSMIVHLTLPDTPLDSVSDNEENERKDIVMVKCQDLFSEYPSRSPRIWFPTPQDQGSPSSMCPVAIWLSSAKEPHGSCSRLHMATIPVGGYPRNDFRVKIVVDSVWEPRAPVDHGGFPGLYVNQLPANPFLFLDGVLHAVCISNWGSNQVVVAIRLSGEYVTPPTSGWDESPMEDRYGSDEHEIFRLQPRGRNTTSFVACDGQNRIVAVASSLTEPNEVFITDMNLRTLRWNDWTGQITDIGGRVKDLLFDLEGEVVDIKGHEPAQTLYVKFCGTENQPLITWPHGGPHSVTAAGFSVETAAFALAGYTVSLPNYRGSLGYGQRWVEELLGKIGTLDVGDVMASAKQMISNGLAQDGPGKQLYMGGSHGGFLGAHVVGQYPSFFSAAVLRNPVVDIPAMHATTDIPDWTVVECGIPYDPSSVLTLQQYQAMHKMSPIQYVDKVITPILLRIGDVDQRVPPSQGREYYHLLKARGMGEKVEMLWYPENSHPLDKVEAERAGWDATLAWFRRYGTTESPS